MNFGCTKHLGCYVTNELIDFGILAPYAGNYTFEIFMNTGFMTMVETFSFNQPIKIPFVFNENSNTIIKIKIDVIKSLI